MHHTFTYLLVLGTLASAYAHYGELAARTPEHDVVTKEAASVVYPDGWSNFIPCYSGSWSSSMITFTWDQNTPTNCMWACQLQGYSYSAVTSGNVCGCSSAYAIAYANEVSSSLCGQQCTGDSSQTCGGAGTYQVYNTTVPHVTIDKQSNYGGASVHVSIPCAENNPRGLMTGPTWNIGQRSPTACVDWCMTYGTSYSPGGYVYPMPFVASDFAGNCQCGYMTKTGAAGFASNYPPSPVPNSYCTSDAGSYLATILGITWTPDVSPLVWPWEMTTACASLAQSGEIFYNPVVTNSTQNTPAWCTSHCAASNYTLAAVASGSLCYCANYFAATPWTDDPWDCNYGNSACAGNSSLWCGGYDETYRAVYVSLGNA